jgi:ATP-dependent RNA helicase DDX52/ROK1
MDIFRSLTVGIKFDKSKLKREAPKKDIEEVKKCDDEEELKEVIPVKKRKKLSEKYVNQKQQEAANKIRKEHHINIKGRHEKEAPIESFEELFTTFKIDDQLKKNILALNYSQPTPVQMQCLPLFLKNMELKVCAQAGTGKSLSFALPLIQNIISSNNFDGIQAIILVPTRELALQILGVTTQLCYGTNVRAHIIKSTSEESMKKFPKKKSNIIIATPLKLVHFIKASTMTLKTVKRIVIDEVDKFFEESNQTFQKDLDVIFEACDNPDRKFALFSATTTKEMTSWVHSHLKDFVTINISPNLPVSAIEQQLKYVGVESAKLMAIREIFREGFTPPVLIFLQSKDRAKQLFAELMYDGFNIDIIHSDRSEKERNEVYRKFREGKIWVLICTELMCRGIDFRNISMVINFDLPTSIVSYVHRVGRVGRAGRSGKAITFYTNDDNKSGLLRDIANLIQKSGSPVEPFLLQLKKSKKKERVALLKKAPKRKIISTKVTFSKKKGGKKRKMKKAPKEEE